MPFFVEQQYIMRFLDMRQEIAKETHQGLCPWFLFFAILWEMPKNCINKTIKALKNGEKCALRRNFGIKNTVKIPFSVSKTGKNKAVLCNSNNWVDTKMQIFSVMTNEKLSETY